MDYSTILLENHMSYQTSLTKFEKKITCYRIKLLKYKIIKNKWFGLFAKYICKFRQSIKLQA